MSDRVDGPCEGDANREVVASREAFHRVSATARSFTHDGGALLCLQVESEFFTSGKGLVRGQYVDRLINKPWPGNPGNRPELVDLVFVTIGEIVNVRGLAEQIRDHKIYHAGIATMVLPQVKDEGIGMRQKVHGRYGCGPADIGRGKRTELDVPNIVREDLN